MKTVKEIADILGVSKQTVFRYLKENHIKETVRDGQTLRFNETVASIIIEGFRAKTDTKKRETVETVEKIQHSDAYIEELKKMNEFLREQLSQANETITANNERAKELNILLLNTQNMLKAEQEKNQLLLETTEKNTRSIWSWFKK